MIPGADPSPPLSVAEISIRDSHAAVVLRGRLDATTLPDIWPKVVPPLRDPGVTHADIDVSGVEYCDGAGIGFLAHVDRLMRSHAGVAAIHGLSGDLSRLLNRALVKPDLKTARPRTSAVTHLGEATAAILRDIRTIIEFVGESVAACIWSFRHPRRVRWEDVLVIAEKAGANAVPVVCLLGWLVGLIISFQSANPLKRYAAESTIPTLLSISMVRELGPLFTAIILAGRSGSAFAAEIGTMKVTEEIDALTTFGLEPVRFLTVPRLIATVLVTPLLSLLCTIAGLAGGWVVMASLGYPFAFYVHAVNNAVDDIDLLQGLFKSGVFALLISGIGCLRGLRTQSGPGAVGDSTTHAVVAGIILVVIADGVLGVVFYMIGI